MKRKKYKVVRAKFDLGLGYEEFLNEMDGKGWGLVATHSEEDPQRGLGARGSSIPFTVMHFKRKPIGRKRKK
jgi:hypothetical protein